MNPYNLHPPESLWVWCSIRGYWNEDLERFVKDKVQATVYTWERACFRVNMGPPGEWLTHDGINPYLITRTQMGKEAIRLLKFLIRFPGWQSYHKEDKIVRAVKTLEDLGFVKVNRKNRLVRFLSSVLQYSDDDIRAIINGKDRKKLEEIIDQIDHSHDCPRLVGGECSCIVNEVHQALS